MSNRPPIRDATWRSPKELTFTGDQSLIPNVPLTFHTNEVAPLVLSNIPLAFTLIPIGRARRYNATAFDAVRVVMNVTTASLDGPEIVAVYTTTPWIATSWKIAGLTDDQVGDIDEDPFCELNVGGVRESEYKDLALAARDDVWWHFATRGGDAATDAELGYLGLEFARSGNPPPALVPWYFRDLFSSADLSLLADSPHTIGDANHMNPFAESDPRTWLPSGAFRVPHTGGGAVAYDPLATPLQLKQVLVDEQAQLEAYSGFGNLGNYYATIGRFATPALLTQNVRRFRALFHFRQTGGSLGGSYCYPVITQYRPGIGIVRQYTARAGDVENAVFKAYSAPTYSPSAGSPLPVDITENLQILMNDRIIVDVKMSTIEDTLAYTRVFYFGGDNFAVPDGPGLPFDFPARIEMPDFQIVPGTE